MQFDIIVVHRRARAEFEAITDFLAKGVKGVGGAKAVAEALRVFATGRIAASAGGFHCGFECDTETLRRGINTVNDANDD